MPIFWKYLSKEYLKVFFLSISAFISILLVTRLKVIASFATLASNYISVVLFTIFQIPYILPFAISISCLISSILLFQRLSQMNELTAFRASGISLKRILSPLLILAIFLSVLNFLITSEITPKCRCKSKELLYEQTSINPIILLQRRQKLAKIKNSYVEINAHNNDQTAKDIIVITPNKSNGRLYFISADNMELKDDELIGKDVSLISYMDSKNNDNFDNLIIENQNIMSTKASAISQFMKSKKWNMTIASMPIRMLLIKSKELKKEANPKIKHAAEIEIARRIAFAISAFTFTFIGACYGIQISRSSTLKSLITVTLLSLIVLTSFTIGKALKKQAIFSIIMYILPQLFVLSFTGYRLKKISRGHE